MTILLGALALINCGFAALLIWPAYVSGAVTGQIPDFAAFWAAGAMTLEGTPALAYDWPAHRTAEVAGLGREFDGWMPWHYPPTAQVLVTPLAVLPLFPAMAVWLAVTGALFLWTCWRILPDRCAVLAGFAAAPTALTLVNGQMGFLLAAAMGLALLNLERMPVRAGTVLAVLSIKPHLVAAVPLVLAAAGRWRALAAGALGTLALAAASWALLGGGTWAAFVTSIERTAAAFTGDGAVVQRWVMGAGAYGWLRYQGFGSGTALAAQGIVSLAVLWLTVRAWRDRALGADIKAALLAYGALAAAPRVLSYDLHILVIGALFQVRHGLRAGFAWWELWLLALAAVGATLSLVAPPGAMPVLAVVLFTGCWAARRGITAG